MKFVKDIRMELAKKYLAEEFVTDKTGVKTVEIDAASFIADEDLIFGTPNQDYINREIEWYKSQSLNVNDIPGGPPAIWTQVSAKREIGIRGSGLVPRTIKPGQINSNYGWCVWSEENFNQFHNCLNTLLEDINSRRATMIYTRPSMQYDFSAGGMSDFCCTYAVQYMIRDGKLNAYVLMRSADAVFGFKNDVAWQKHIIGDLYAALRSKYVDLKLGDIHWHAVSLHVYERHFPLIENFINSGYEPKGN